MDITLDTFKIIADKPLEFNKDINQHIISCRRALQTIELKDRQLKQVYDTLEAKNNENFCLKRRIFDLEEQVKRLEGKSEEQRQVILESYRQIRELINGKICDLIDG